MGKITFTELINYFMLNMKLNRSIFLTSICALICSQTSWAVLTGSENEWMPEWLNHEKRAALLSVIEKEPVSEPIPEDEIKILGMEDCLSKADYGYGWGFVDEHRLECLKEVKRRSHDDYNRPRVLDVGAGLGHMGWKLIVAGAHYTAIEQEKRALVGLQANLIGARDFLKPGEKLKSVAKIIHQDFLAFAAEIRDNPQKKSELFDVIWMGDVLHFLNPDQVDISLQTAFNLLNYGGEIFAIVDTPSILNRSRSYTGANQIAELFFRNRSESLPYPGSLVLNLETSMTFMISSKDERIESLTTDSTQIVSGVHTSHASLADLRIQPGETQLGHIGESYNSLAKSSNHTNRSSSTNQEAIHIRSKQKRAFHIFDSHALSFAFQKQGFQVMDVFYTDSSGKRVTRQPMSPKNFETGFYKVGIRAKKP
jgi:SAM-dependent methyltransferase